jgi:cysteinyl-tRNA synthetase
MLETLYYTAKNIVNEKMVEEYRESLEFSNKALTQKNEELQSLVRILDSKLLQISQEDKDKIQEIDLSTADIKEQYLNELKELEIDISGAAVLISLSKKLHISNIQVLGNMFLSYANILSEYKAYDELYQEIEKLGTILNNAPQNFIDRVSDIATLLESFIYVLRMWRTKLVEKKFIKAFEFHSSMINDVTTIIAIIDGSENSIETEMEFF